MNFDTRTILLIASIAIGVVIYVLTLTGSFIIAKLLFENSTIYTFTYYIDSPTLNLSTNDVVTNVSSDNQTINANIQFRQLLKTKLISTDIISDSNKLNLAKFAIIILIMILLISFLAVIVVLYSRI